MRNKSCTIDEYALKSLFRLGREVALTSVWLGVVLVLGLCAVTLPFRSALMKTPESAPLMLQPAARRAGVGSSFKWPV
jgi:hypothetical protein